jgi:hypothetical protein
MDILKIDPETFEPIHPDGVFEGATSKIWTERYFEPGEFEIRTPLVEDSILGLPKWSLISLLDSDEIMMVESHEPVVNDEGKVELAIKGRSLVDIFNYRAILGLAKNDGETWIMHADKHTRMDKILRVMYNAVINNTTQDFCFPYPEGSLPQRWQYPGQYTSIDNAVVTDSTTITDGISVPKVQPSQAFALMQNWMKVKTLGVRVVRPRPQSDSSKVVTMNPSTENIVKTTTANIQQMRFDLYNGIDRSGEVIFSSRLGDLQGSNYLFSIKNYVNWHRIYNKQEQGNWIRALNGPGEPEPSYPNGNLANRFLGVYVAPPEQADLISYMEDTPDQQFFPTQAQEDAYDAYQDIKAETVETSRKDRPYTNLWSGEISKTSKLKYGQDYFLGDTVTLQGDYGVVQKMVVIENIRTEDAEGERSYPGLVIPGSYT